MKFLVLTDLHNQCSAFEWIERLETDDIDAILFLGDVTDLGTSEEGVNTLKRFKRPVIYSFRLFGSNLFWAGILPHRLMR